MYAKGSKGTQMDTANTNLPKDTNGGTQNPPTEELVKPAEQPAPANTPKPIDTPAAIAANPNEQQYTAAQTAPNQSPGPVAPSPNPTTPALTTVPSQPANPPVAQQKTSASHVVLQWVTYAFWLWTAWALISLVVSVLIQTVVPDTNTGEFSLYALAATLVLLPVATICDLMYSKNEEQHKRGAATAVMLIHAVLFALLTVGALISAVFALITFVVSASANEGITTWFVSSLIATVIFGALFTRTVFGVKIPHFRKALVIGMSVVTIGFTIAAFVGPVATMVQTKDDKLIRENIGSVARDIDDYVNKNSKLPESLNDIAATGDTKILIERNLVTYTPENNAILPNTSTLSTRTLYLSESRKYNFTLCATYKADYNTEESAFSSYATDSDGSEAASSFYLYGNKKGKQCYKLYATDPGDDASIYR